MSLTTGSGNDTIRSGSGDDTVDGGGGNDVLEGGLGTNTIIGGSGSNTASYEHLTDAVPFGNIGVTVDLAAGTATGPTLIFSPVLNDTLTDIQNVVGSDNNDKLTGDTNANTLTGGAGNDALDGGAGQDILIGGAGNDTYFIRDAGDTVTESAGEGADVVKATVSYTLTDNVERLYLQNGGNISGTGSALANLIIGNKGNNYIFGKDGNDTLTGGGGHDVFVFDTTPNNTTNHDRITDFNLIEDRIGLSPDIFQGLDLDSNGQIDDGQFAVIDATSKPNAEAHLFYRSDKGALYYDADGYGGQQYKAVLVAVFDGKPALDASFFDVLQP